MNSLQLTREPHGDLAVVRVAFGDVASSASRDDLMVDGVRSLINEIVELTTKSSEDQAPTGLAIDIRTPDGSTAGMAQAHRAAFIEACHGLVHSYVAEERIAIVPVNIIVSADGQESDRTTTLDYLASPDAVFARGAIFDLRNAS